MPYARRSRSRKPKRYARKYKRTTKITKYRKSQAKNDHDNVITFLDHTCEIIDFNDLQQVGTQKVYVSIFAGLFTLQDNELFKLYKTLYDDVKVVGIKSTVKFSDIQLADQSVLKTCDVSRCVDYNGMPPGFDQNTISAQTLYSYNSVIRTDTKLQNAGYTYNLKPKLEPNKYVPMNWMSQIIAQGLTPVEGNSTSLNCPFNPNILTMLVPHFTPQGVTADTPLFQIARDTKVTLSFRHRRLSPLVCPIIPQIKTIKINPIGQPIMYPSFISNGTLATQPQILSELKTLFPSTSSVNEKSFEIQTIGEVSSDINGPISWIDESKVPQPFQALNRILISFPFRQDGDFWEDYLDKMATYIRRSYDNITQYTPFSSISNIKSIRMFEKIESQSYPGIGWCHDCCSGPQYNTDIVLEDQVAQEYRWPVQSGYNQEPISFITQNYTANKIMIQL